MPTANEVATPAREESGPGVLQGSTKVEQYGWTTEDRPGEMVWLSKHLLNVDHTYQRERISKQRVLHIRKRWSWVACGVLIVGQRPDGTFWVIDGQHRKLSADDRDDITELPCIVFKLTDIACEAQGFIDANTVRGAITSYAKFRAQLTANDPLATAIKAMVEQTGYHIHDSGKRFTVSCITTLASWYVKDATTAIAIWKLCTTEIYVDEHEGKPVHNRIYGGLCWLEKRLQRTDVGSLLDRRNRAVLKAAGPDKLLNKMNEAAGFYGKGGEAVTAQGIVNLLNYRRSTYKLPNTITLD